jgi:hypothetical protein
VNLTRWLSVAVAVLALVGPVAAAEDRAPAREISFGTLASPDLTTAKVQAEAWLKSVGKYDQAKFEAIWDAKADTAILDRVTDTLTLGSAEAAKVLAEAKDLTSAPPTEMPALLKPAKKADYLRDNLTLAWAKALSNKRIYEEALEALKTLKPETVVDPAGYFFHRAVAEHALMLKKEADESIARLLDDVVDAPERYKMVGALMAFDMLTWRDKDLGWISRKMDNIQRRLDLTRGGKQTQKMQKEVVARLDEIIKELENQKKNCSGCNGGNCPNGGQQKGQDNPNTKNSGNPLQDSVGNGQGGPGLVDQKKVKELAEVWGKLPEKERAKALVELTRNMSPKHRDQIETYFKQITARANRSAD